MTNRLKYRSGLTQLVKMRVDEPSVIHPGDLVYLDNGIIRPARFFAWTSNLSATQDRFADFFAGVAHQWSAAGQVDDISVDISPLSIYEFDCTPAAYEVGDPLSLAEVLLGPGKAVLSSHRLQLPAAGVRCIARAAEYQTPDSNSIRVNLVSALHAATADQRG